VWCDVVVLVERVFQADGAEQEGVRVCRQRGMSGEQGAEETLSTLPLQEVPLRRHEARRSAHRTELMNDT